MSSFGETLREFLVSSDFHGLRYLVLARHQAAKFLWFTSICACVASAAAVIYLNVDNWSNTPAVVTNVHHTLAQGSNFMPMVTVCPRRPNYNILLFNLLNKHPGLTKQLDVISKIRAIILESMVERQTYANSDQSHGYELVSESFAPIFEPYLKDNLLKGTEEYEFVWTLLEVASKVEYNLTGIHAYILNSALSETPLSIETFREFMQSFYEIELKGERMEIDLEDEAIRVSFLLMYSYFFPLQVKRTDGNYELDVLRPLSEYELPKLSSNNLSFHDVPSLVAYLIDLNFFDDPSLLTDAQSKRINNLALDLLSTYSGAHLEIDADVKTIYDFAESFSYDSTFHLFSGLYRKEENETGPCDERKENFHTGSNNFSILGLCTSDIIPDKKCQEYCGKTVLNQTVHKLAMEFFEMSTDIFGVLQNDNPQSLLPMCQFAGEEKTSSDCWRKVVTDRGICFSSRTDGSKSAIRGVGPRHALRFAVDAGGSYDFYHSVQNLAMQQLNQQEYDVILTPPNHFAIGRLSEEGEAVHKYKASDGSKTTTIKVEVDLISEGTSQFKAMRPEKRNCYYPHEKWLLHFPLYSEPNCVLECAWDIARAKCDCVPWFLHDNFPKDLMCEAYGNECFRGIVAERYNQQNADHECIKGCLPDCETVEYNIKEAEFDITGYRYEGLNENNAFYYDYVTQNKTENADPKIMDFLKPVWKNHTNLCNTGLVRVFVSKKSTLRIVLTATVTLVDMISNIGGTLGLFCGFSILSAAEIVYWIGVFVARRADPT